MNEQELRASATCAVCKRKIGAVGLLSFWRVRIERHGVDMRAVKRQAGLEMMLGSPALAKVFSPEEEFTIPVMDPVTLTVCEDCCLTKNVCVAELAEMGQS